MEAEGTLRRSIRIQTKNEQKIEKRTGHDNSAETTSFPEDSEAAKVEVKALTSEALTK